MTSSATADFRRGCERGDPEAILGALAPDAGLRSPVAGGLIFRGRNQLRALFTATTEAYEQLTVTNDFGSGNQHVLGFRAKIGRQEFEETLLLRIDERGLISELSASIRPLAGVAAVGAAVGQRLARRHGRTRAAAMATLIRPIALATRMGEPIGSRLLDVDEGLGDDRGKAG